MTEANDKPEEKIQEAADAPADAPEDDAEQESAWAHDDADTDSDSVLDLDPAEAAADAAVLELAELRDKLLRSLAENENLL
ncbi:MAG: hypothetical protein V3R85_05355, partial [Alphaproteobacteria bacterium]